jgi:hypothetical protein
LSVYKWIFVILGPTPFSIEILENGDLFKVRIELSIFMGKKPLSSDDHSGVGSQSGGCFGKDFTLDPRTRG